jgi:hypothetical protein
MEAMRRFSQGTGRAYGSGMSRGESLDGAETDEDFATPPCTSFTAAFAPRLPLFSHIGSWPAVKDENDNPLLTVHINVLKITLFTSSRLFFSTIRDIVPVSMPAGIIRPL